LIVSNQGGTLAGVTVDGTAGNPSPLDLSTNPGAYVYVSGGLTLDGATVRLGRPDGSTYGGLYFTGAAQVLDGTAARPGKIFMGFHSGNGLFASGAGPLTLGSHLAISGTAGRIDAGSNTFDNQAVITADPTILVTGPGTIAL